MSAIKLSSRYAKSIIDLAIEKNQLEAIHNDMRSFQQVCAASRDFVLMLRNPIVHQDKKLNVLNQLFAKSFSPFTMSFLTLVVNKGREGFLPDMARAVVLQYNQIKGITEVTLTTATEAGKDLIEKVKQMVSAATGTSAIDMHTKINPDLLGGFILQYNDQMLDASVHRQLEILDDNFLDNSYIKKY